MQTLVVNIMGGPGVGKSGLAHGLMYELKLSGIECEMTPEYAKDVLFEESPTKLDNQIYIFGKQYHRMKRIVDKVQVIVTDAPLLHSIHYSNNASETFNQLVMEKYESFTNFNVFLTRKHSYNPLGRFQDEKGAEEIHSSIADIIKKYNIPTHNFQTSLDKTMSREELYRLSDMVESKINEFRYSQV